MNNRYKGAFQWLKSLHLWAALGIFGLIAIMSLAYGFQWKFIDEGGNSHGLVSYFRMVSIPYVILVIGLTAVAARDWNRITYAVSWPEVIGFVLMAFSFSLTLFLRSKALDPLPWWLVTFLAIGIAGYAHSRGGARASTIAFFAFALGLYAFMIYRVPMLAEGANMLPSISYAARDFLAGKNPFLEVYEEVTTYQFMYLPGLWLPYTLFEAVGADLRIFNLLALVFIVWVFERGLPGKVSPSVLSIAFYPIMLSHVVAGHIVNGHVWPYWVFLLLSMVFLARNRYLWAAVLFGLALATRQGSLFVVGPLAAYLYWQVGWRKLFIYSGVALLTYAIVMIPFSLSDGKEFWSVVYLSTSSMADELYLVLHQITATHGMALLGMEQYLLYAQGLIVLLGTVVIFLAGQKMTFSWFLYVTGVVYLWLVLFNPYVVRYVYLPGIYLMVLAICMQTARTSVTGRG